MTDVLIERHGLAGRITLNRPSSLNALNHSMVRAINEALELWSKDDDVSLLIIDSAGEKAFCAGGDIVDIYNTGLSQPEKIRSFWSDEYLMNALLHSYEKPVVSVLNGVVMGGGVGVGCHASHRIVTERSLIAMPEVNIGFCPDVGGTWLLARAPGHIGEYLGMTGARMNAGDSIIAGFADVFLPSSKVHVLVDALEQTGDISLINKFVEPVPESTIAANRQLIDRHFAISSASSILENLVGTAFAEKAAVAIKMACPSAVSAALFAIRAARTDKNISQSLTREFRYAYRSLDGSNFYEGIRAAVIDKDRMPKWQPSRIEDVSPQYVEEAFSSLGNSEWKRGPTS